MAGHILECFVIHFFSIGGLGMRLGNSTRRGRPEKIFKKTNNEPLPGAA